MTSQLYLQLKLGIVTCTCKQKLGAVNLNMLLVGNIEKIGTFLLHGITESTVWYVQL